VKMELAKISKRVFWCVFVYHSLCRLFKEGLIFIGELQLWFCWRDDWPSRGLVGAHFQGGFKVVGTRRESLRRGFSKDPP